MPQDPTHQDPLEMLKNMWSGMGFALPGMVAPIVDTGELEKRIADLKTVEGWLKVNLNMLQVTIQGLEMQRATLVAMNALSQSATGAEGMTNPFSNAALWPWNFMQPASAPAGQGEEADADQDAKKQA